MNYRGSRNDNKKKPRKYEPKKSDFRCYTVYSVISYKLISA